MNTLHKNNSFKPNENFEIDHDPKFIRFAYWSTLNSFNENNPPESRKGQQTIFLNNCYQGSPSREGQIKNSVSIKNDCNNPVLNFYIYSKKARKTILKLPLIPENESIRLEFEKEGMYEVRFFVPGSKSFAKVNLNVLPRISTPISRNFEWNLKPSW